MNNDYIDESELQFWHGFFNKEFFNNELSPVIIRIEECDDDDPGVEAVFLGKYEDCGGINQIVFFHYSLEMGDDYSEDML